MMCDEVSGYVLQFSIARASRSWPLFVSRPGGGRMATRRPMDGSILKTSEV